MIYPKGILFDGRVVNFSCGILEPFEGYELMQYTGLKDKNGKEIYEGDIVKYKSFGKELISNVIQDLRLGTGHYIKGEHVGFYSINESTVKNFEIEVIGNIFQGGDLLRDS